MTKPLRAPDPDADPREFRWVPASALIVDQRKQRECDPEKVARIVNEWDWRKFEAITVAESNGRLEVVEGQHRTLAAQARHADTLVPCMVIVETLTDREQAQVALDITMGRRGHSAYELWRLRYNAGHEHEIYATTALERHGLRVGRGQSSTTIGAVATVRRIVHGGNFTPEFGAELLDRTIIVLMSAFPTYDHESNVTRWDRYMLLAVANLLLSYPEADGKRLAGVLRVRPAVQWVNLGRGADTPTPDMAIRLAVMAEYNRGKKRGRLGE